ncbi:MAG: hypothetical protein H7A19_08810 [Rhodanobacteraceae bacterium]|nr:hypothetical protein [Rhodanobacteraceae bacterium]
MSGHVGVGGREHPAFWWRGGNVGVGNAPGASRVGMCGRLEARGREDPAFYEGFPNVKESAARFAFRYMNFRCRCGDPAVILK